MHYVRSETQAALLAVLLPWAPVIDWKARLPSDPTFAQYFRYPPPLAAPPPKPLALSCF